MASINAAPQGDPGASGHLVRSVLWLAPAAAAGVVSGLSLWGSVLLIVMLVLAFLLSTRVLSPLDLLVALAPLMFFSPVTGSLHLALSDLIAPVFAIFLAARVTWASAMDVGRPLLRYSTAVILLLSWSMVLTSLTDEGFMLGLGISNSMKLVVGLGYASLVAMWVGNAELSDVIRTLRLWTWVATVLATGSVLTELGVADLIPSDGTRSLGYFQDPNLYAGYLLLSLALVLVVEAFATKRFTIVQLLLITGGVIATGSRGAVGTLVILVVAASLMLAIRRVRVALFAAALFVVALVTTLVAGTSVLPVIPALARLVQASQAVDADPRLGLWGRAISLWESHPLFGVGIGQFGRFSIDVYGISPDTGIGYIAHNSFLSFLAELGIVGCAVAVVGLSWLALQVKNATALNRNVRRALNIGLLSLVAEMMSLNLQNVRYVWIYIGIVVGLVAISRRELSKDKTYSQVSDSPPDDQSLPRRGGQSLRARPDRPSPSAIAVGSRPAPAPSSRS